MPALQPGNGASLYGYYHLVTAADDSVASWNWTLSSAQKWGGGISRYLNVDPNQPFDTNVSTALSNANVSSITVPSVTTVSAGAMLIGAVGADSATTAVTVPTGWTETWQSGAGQLSEHAYLGAPTPGASGTVTWTQSQARAIAAWTTALRPAVPHDPVIAAAGDIACDVNSTSYNGGAGTGTACMQRAVSDLLVNQPWDGILPLGDNQYESGQLLNFQRVYDPTWGRLRFVSYPIPGNHEYQTAGGAGYYSYYGAAAGDPAKGYYSYDLGKWHLIALNGECASVAGCGPGSAQEQWLAADLAAHPTSCTLAYWHEPRFSSGSEHGNDPTYDAFWRDLYGAGAEIVLNGHDHDYERFAPQTPDAVADTASGVREFVVGTGGINQMPFGTLRSNSDYRANGFGALRLTLHDGTYDWSFLSIDGSITDSGSGSCH